MPDRQSRYAAFAQFCKESKKLFEKYADNPKSKRLDSLYTFYVEHDIQNNKSIDIFYGNRPFNSITIHDKNHNKINKLEMASGATLKYQLTDDGRVLCTMYPASSENFHFSEDFILLDTVKDPAKLEKKSKCHWKLFQAYMESTCLDGEPNSIQKLYLIYLSFFKRYVINKTVQPRKFITFLCTIAKYSLTVGLSGFIILAISWFKDSSSSNQVAERHQELMKSLLVISDNLRSISNYTKEFNEIAEESQRDTRDSFNLINSTILKSTLRIENIVHSKDAKETE